MNAWHKQQSGSLYSIRSTEFSPGTSIFGGFVLAVGDPPSVTGTPGVVDRISFRLGEPVGIEIHNNGGAKMVTLRLIHDTAGQVDERRVQVPDHKKAILTMSLDRLGTYTVIATSYQNPSDPARVTFDVSLYPNMRPF